MKEETLSFFQVGTPLALIALGLGYLTYQISNVVPFIKSPLFFIPACLMLGPVMLLEGFEKDYKWHLGLLWIYYIYSLAFGFVMFPAFVVVWIIWLAFIYPIKREEKMNFNIK